VPTSRDPIADTDRLVVDGSNLLPSLARRGGTVPQAAVIGRLRAAIPPTIAIELVFDGAPDPGLRGERIASGVSVRHAGRRTADEVILGLVEHALMSGGSHASHAILVVTDDRELADGVRQLGGRTTGTAWLLSRFDRPRLSSPSVGNRRPPTPTDAAQGQERDPWQPGRGATTKRGNPRRRRRSSGSMPT
jgi:hypothetical protein